MRVRVRAWILASSRVTKRRHDGRARSLSARTSDSGVGVKAGGGEGGGRGGMLAEQDRGALA